MMAIVSWESFDRWPDESPDGGAFRGRSEPIVAHRNGVTLRERWRLFWKHSPDHDSKRAVQRAMLTSTHLYVRRVDGSKGRLPREMVRACRRMDHRLLFGVDDGEDIILMHRNDDSLEEELINLAGASGEAWVHQSSLSPTIWLTFVGLGFAVGLFSEYSLTELRDRWSHGLYTAEVCLGVYAGVLAILVALFAVFWLPSRIHVDRLGVERRRGVFGIFHFYVPADRVELVVSQHGPPGFETMLIFDRKVYVGTVRATRSLLAAKFHGPAGRNLTLRLSEQLRTLLGAPHRNLTH